MSRTANRRKVFFSVITLLVLLAGASSSYGQCGAYLRHASTQFFPYPKVYLDGAADMNGDGKLDLLASQNLSGGVFSRNRLFIIPGSGTGTFGAPILIDPPSGAFSYQWRVGRVNGDSLNDIIAYGSSGGSYVYLNTGGGTFAAPITSNVLPGVLWELVDINNDGKNDFTAYSNGFRYALGNGDGTFGTAVEIEPNGAAWSGRFNNDALPDFINARKLYINNGDGTFTTSDVSSFFGSGNLSAVKDLNGDGLSDVVVNTQTGFTILKRTAGGFDATSYTVPNFVNGQSSGQMISANGDSFIDLVFSNRTSNVKYVYTGDATGSFTRGDYDQKFFYYNFLNTAVGDFDGDGRDDVVQMTSGITNTTLMLPDDVTSMTFKKNVCTRPGQPRIVDFDATGNTDYSFWNPATGEWAWRANPYDQETNATETVSWGSGSLGDIPAPGDFDGDGVSDRAVFRNSTGVWYIRRSSDLRWYVLPFGSSGDKPVVADYDGDTISDIAVWRPSDGNWYIWYMGTQTYAIVHFGLDGDRPAAADYDGDLKTDIGVFRPSTGVWYYLKSSNGAFVYAQWGIDGDRPMPADYDGDGKEDIAVFRESNRFMYIVRSYNSAIVYYQVGLAGDIPQVADYDGDYVADIGFYRPSNRLWYTSARGHGAIFGADNIIPVSSIIRGE